MPPKNVLDRRLWEEIKQEAEEKFDVFPSAYASYWIVNQYKARGGRYDNMKSRQEPLRRWTEEKWVNICETDSKGNYLPCGRKRANLLSAEYPLCRPSVRISSKTPMLVDELTPADIERMCRWKHSVAQPSRIRFPDSRESLRQKALRLGASEFGRSPQKHKKWYVVYQGHTIHFGDNRYSDFTMHHDPARRERYLARAKGIRDGSGQLTWQNPFSANFWAVHLLW